MKEYVCSSKSGYKNTSLKKYLQKKDFKPFSNIHYKGIIALDQNQYRIELLSNNVIRKFLKEMYRLSQNSRNLFEAKF